MKRLLYPILALTLIASSCKKKGCIDSDATNYDSKAKKDDGSCVYPEVIDVIDINSKAQYAFTIDGSETSNTISQTITQGHSSSSGNGGDVLGAFFYDDASELSLLSIEKGVKPNNVNLTDSELEDYFSVGNYTYSDNSSDVGFQVSMQESMTKYYSSRYGSQSGSTLKIVSVSNQYFGSKLYIKAYIEFSCKVYNQDDFSDSKTITDGKAVLVFTDL